MISKSIKNLAPVFYWFFFASTICSAESIKATTWSYQVVQKFQHPQQAFTQGLEIVDNKVFESSGLYGKSFLSRWSLDEKPQPIKKALSPMIFAEGITLLNGKGYLISWQNQRGFVFDPATLRISSSFSYRGEGWGLANDGKSLIMSNGTAELRWLSPENFKIEKTLTVKLNGELLKKLNELEWVDNRLFANIWQTTTVAAINPDNGNVIATIDFAELQKAESNNPAADVLNGIAYDKKTETFLIAGKNWQWIYRVKLIQSLHSQK